MPVDYLANGRSKANASSSGLRILNKPPRDEKWVWLTTEMMDSPAWCAMSINARKIIDLLMIEHRQHGGYQNGLLICPHSQMRQYGVNHNCIAAAIDELVFLGIIRVKRGGPAEGGRAPNLYQLTWIGDHAGNPPCNAWKGLTEEKINVWRQKRQNNRRRRREWKQKQKCPPNVGPQAHTNVEA